MLGQAELDDLLASRDRLNQQLQQILDNRRPWGIKVSAVEVKHVDLPEDMQRAMARQAEAEREKRAKIIHAEGELIASEKLSQAAGVINKEPARYAPLPADAERDCHRENSTIVFPLPIQLLELLQAARADPRNGLRRADRVAASRPATSHMSAARSQSTSAKSRCGSSITTWTPPHARRHVGVVEIADVQGARRGRAREPQRFAETAVGLLVAGNRRSMTRVS